MVLYVSRRLTKVTRTTMRNKRRHRHLWVCANLRRAVPRWWDIEQHRFEVTHLSLPVQQRLELFARLGRAVVPWAARGRPSSGRLRSVLRSKREPIRIRQVATLSQPEIQPSSMPVALRYRLRPPLYKIVIAVLASGSALLHGYYLVVGITWGALVVVVALQPVLIRLSADERGVRVQNGVAETFPWTEIAEIKLAQRSVWGFRRVQLEIALTNGRIIQPRAARAGDDYGHTYADLDRVAQQLEMMRRAARGITDPPELAAALDAAKRGDPHPIDDMLAAHAVDATLYEQRLHQLAETGEIDMEELRRKRREDLGATGTALVGRRGANDSRRAGGDGGDGQDDEDA
jgi:hypothetical protein